MNLKKIAQVLEKERCTMHNEKPIVKVKKDFIELNCCCDNFQNKLVKKMDSEISKQIEYDLNNALNF